MMFIGDGSTDVPCLKLVKNQGGHAIAVYSEERDESKDYALRLLRDGRVNFIAEGLLFFFGPLCSVFDVNVPLWEGYFYFCVVECRQYFVPD